MNFTYIYVLDHNKAGTGWVVKDIVIAYSQDIMSEAGKYIIAYNGMGKTYSWTKNPDNAYITPE